MIKLPLFQVEVRRNAHTVVNTYVPEHELPLLYHLYGRENVVAQPCEGQFAVDTDHETIRLSRKYGEAVVVKIYGEAHSAQLSARLQQVSRSLKAKGKSPPGETVSSPDA